MIFTGFKRKTNQIFFNKKLKQSKSILETSTKKFISKVFIILDSLEHKDEIVADLSKQLEISKKNIEVVVFQQKRTSKEAANSVFYPSNFGWYGKIKSPLLNNSLTKKYDLLINYSKVDNVYVNIVLLQSKVDFKVGFAHLNEDLYELVIDCNKEDYKTFNKEIKKYLTILNKLECKN